MFQEHGLILSEVEQKGGFKIVYGFNFSIINRDLGDLRWTLPLRPVSKASLSGLRTSQRNVAGI